MYSARHARALLLDDGQVDFSLNSRTSVQLAVEILHKLRTSMVSGSVLHNTTLDIMKVSAVRSRDFEMRLSWFVICGGKAQCSAVDEVSDERWL